MFLDRLTAFIFLVAFALLLLVLEMVRRRALAERYSLLWLGAASGLIVLALSRSVLDRIAELVGVGYPPTVLFVVGFGSVTMILLYLSAVITQLTRENRIAAQRIGLMQVRIEQLEKSLGHASGDAD